MHSNDEGMGGGEGVEHASPPAMRTAGLERVGALPDADLLAGTRRLVCQSNRALAALLAHLAEVEARGLHRTRACATLYTYCIYELRMSEDTAFRRVAAARLVKRFPLLFEAIERGELHLTGLIVLGPHLTEANVAGVLARAKFRTKKEIMKLVRLLSPLPDVPSRIEPLGPARPAHPFSRPTWSAFMASFCPVRELQPDERPSSWLPADTLNIGMELAPAETASRAALAGAAIAHAPAPAPDRAGTSVLSPEEMARHAFHNDDDAIAPAPDRAGTSVLSLGQSVNADAWIHGYSAPVLSHEPLAPASLQSVPAKARPDDTAASLSGPQRYKVQFTASEEYVALVDEAKALLAHSLPCADVAEIHLRALRTLVAALKQRKYAACAARSKRTEVHSESSTTYSSKSVSTSERPARRARVASSPPKSATSPLDDSMSVTRSEPPADAAPVSLASTLDTPTPRTEPQRSHTARSDEPESTRRRGRHVPAAVRRAVFERDDNRCAYVDARGVRCLETSRLELHHHEPFARGGRSTPENLSLYCSAHNALAAERDFGHASTVAKREHPHLTERTLTCEMTYEVPPVQHGVRAGK